ncbi:scavenger receptor cysteine-rich type 1 protein M160 [Trematomus bernacchii]|uniref:scavenger receptor cysteine-rich type 1 protein M160 n=1 Tax=Trematomus bernacchii TaxID=40690 RepID=UPI001469F814|nr:scavenger receptor cysteine-rich type 1 protein M160 [Trematomus bernacchii]
MMLLLFLFLLLCTAIAKGEDRLILINGSNPCEGYIQIYHDNKLGYIGDKHWSNKTEDVVCKSTQCGKGVGSTQEPAMLPIDRVWLNEVECKGDELHLGECTHPGFGISQFDTGTLRKIQCSNKINISLQGYACAGAVQYSTDAGQTYPGYFCGDSGWDKDASNILCKSLKCGTAKEIPKKPWITLKQSEKMWADCSGIKGLTNLWQCATEKKGSACPNPATVICSDHEILQLSGDASNVCSGRLEQRVGEAFTPFRNNNHSKEWCERMHCGTSANSSLAADGLQLNCTDHVRVVLMDNGEPSRCYGEVYIMRNNSPQPVCASGWTNTEADVVCKELRCGSSVLSNDEKSPRGAEMDNGIMHNVECSGKESSLWHCRAQRDKKLRCSSKAYVVCSDSMEVKLKDTPGKCAGRLEIKYEGKWQRVDKKGWTDTNSEVVCNQLKCTKSIKKNKDDFQKYSPGSATFLSKTITCGKDDVSISKCVTRTTSNRRNSDFGRPDSNVNKEEAVGITCEGHKMIILEEDSCSGKVGIKTLQQTYWLSGSNATWNQETANTVCRETHCGEALNVTNTQPGPEEKVWDKLYNCSHNETSLFDCGETQNPKDLNFTIATVKCSGVKTFNLSEDCWGYVNVCLKEKCGGVCANPWTDDDSSMVCKSQHCGEHVLKPITKTRERRDVKFKSVHSTEKTHNPTKCNLVSFDDNDKSCDDNPAYVVCSGSVKARFTPSRENCSGGLEVNYENKWLQVCKDALKDNKTRNTICREQGCGQAVDEIKDGPKTTKGPVISQIQCSGDDTVTQCMMKTNDGPCTPADLQCSSSSTFVLVGGDTACSGNLLVDSKEKERSAVSTEGWTETMGEILCSNLKCGNLMSNETRKTAASWTTSFSCAGVQNLESIWDCEKKTSSSNPNQIFIKCQDDPKVKLSAKCTGELKVNDLEVCSTNWEDRYSRLVCQELNCSNAIGFSVDKNPIKDKEYFHVNCEKNHYQIGQCKRVEGKCDTKLVSVFCAGNVEFNSTEKCGGQIQVNYRNKWEKVCPLATTFPEKLLEKLCKKLDCEGYNSSIKGSDDLKEVDLATTTLSCTKDHNDPRHCVEIKSCPNEKPAEIYCNGYVSKFIKLEVPSFPTVGIILGVGLLLVLVIIIVVIIRICIVTKGKNISLRILRKRMSTKEVEIESGDYDNVPDMSNQMEDLGAARFREDGSFHSNNDVSDAAEMQPLTLQTLTAAEGEHLLQVVPMDKVSDGVTVEEEDPQEDYDDIEAYPEFTQTEAEVHESPQESTAEEPLLVEGDDDYLVPGQDG